MEISIRPPSGVNFAAFFTRFQNDLLQARGIGPAMMFPRFEAPGHVDIFADQIAGRNAERVLDRAVNVHGVAVQLEFAMRDPGEIEQIVDEERFELDVALEDFEIVAEIVA